VRELQFFKSKVTQPWLYVLVITQESKHVKQVNALAAFQREPNKSGTVSQKERHNFGSQQKTPAQIQIDELRSGNE
jgi:hypothetical protein